MQVEYATDIIFKKQQDLAIIYDNLVRLAVLSVKPEHIATFLGKKLHGNYLDEMGNRFDTRILGTRISHSMRPVSIKMYDKFSLILRIETTVNDASFFKHYREVVKRDGSKEYKQAHLKKNIYSLFDLQKLLKAANSRYLQFICAIDDDSSGRKNLCEISKPVIEKSRSYKGINFFDQDDCLLMSAIISGEFHISGLSNKLLRSKLPEKNSRQISRQLKRLRCHGLIKKVRNTYKYYLTKFGETVIATALKIKELFVIPQLCSLQNG